MKEGQELFALALISELEVQKEENAVYKAKADTLDKITLEIQRLSQLYTLEGIKEGSIESFQNSSVQNALFSVQAIIEKEMADFVNSSKKTSKKA